MQGTADQRRHLAQGGAMPPSLRWLLSALVGATLLGAIYLIAVRGDALLTDLSALGAVLMCF